MLSNYILALLKYMLELLKKMLVLTKINLTKKQLVYQQHWLYFKNSQLACRENNFILSSIMLAFKPCFFNLKWQYFSLLNRPCLSATNNLYFYTSYNMIQQLFTCVRNQEGDEDMSSMSSLGPKVWNQ